MTLSQNSHYEGTADRGVSSRTPIIAGDLTYGGQAFVHRKDRC
jgi:hypothetical protein